MLATNMLPMLVVIAANIALTILDIPQAFPTIGTVQMIREQMFFCLRLRLLSLPSFHVPLNGFKVFLRYYGRVGILDDYLLFFR
ncbi:hypothetical protein D3C74_378330 [compost metagenome]